MMKSGIININVAAFMIRGRPLFVWRITAIWESKTEKQWLCLKKLKINVQTRT